MTIIEYLKSNKISLDDVPKIPLPKTTYGSHTVTPTMALSWLIHYFGKNRPFVAAHADSFVRVIMKGEFSLTGEPIIFSILGLLLNGQHRLAACVVAGKPITIDIRLGVPDEYFDKMDEVLKRTNGATLAVEGVSNYMVASSAVKMIEDYANEQMRHRIKHRNSEVLALYEKFKSADPGLDRSISLGKSFTKFCITSVIAAMHYLFSKADGHGADEFFEQLKTGADLRSDDPLLYLREHLISVKNQKTTLKPYDHAERIIKAWNFRRNGVAGRRTKKSIESRDEIFPMIDGVAPVDVLRKVSNNAQSAAASFVPLMRTVVGAMLRQRKFTPHFIKEFLRVGTRKSTAYATILSCAPESIRIVQGNQRNVKLMYSPTPLVESIYTLKTAKEREERIEAIIKDLLQWLLGKDPDTLGIELSGSEQDIAKRVRHALESDNKKMAA